MLFCIGPLQTLLDVSMEVAREESTRIIRSMVISLLHFYSIYAVITPEEFIYNFYYSVLIFIKLFFSNFRPLTCFSVTIPDAV